MEVANQHPRTEDAPTRGARTPAAAGSISEPTERMPSRMARPLRQESLGCQNLEGDAQHPSAEAERAAAFDLDLWLPRTSVMEQLTLQVRTRQLLMEIHHMMNGTRTMAHVIFDVREGRHSPPPTMEHASQWRYVAARLMAHMGAYTPGDLDRLHWRWHHRAALRIREALSDKTSGRSGRPFPRGHPPRGGPRDTKANGPRRPRDSGTHCRH